LGDGSTSFVVGDGVAKFMQTTFRARMYVAMAASVLHAQKGGGQDGCSSVRRIDHEQRPQPSDGCLHNQTLVAQVIGDNMHRPDVPAFPEYMNGDENYETTHDESRLAIHVHRSVFVVENTFF
jgi:hypothetical protein